MAREVLHLPFHLGGRGVPNLPRQIVALQAGIVCRMFHPAPASWKVVAASWWGAGLRSLLSAGDTGTFANSLPPRVAGY